MERSYKAAVLGFVICDPCNAVLLLSLPPSRHPPNLGSQAPMPQERACRTQLPFHDASAADSPVRSQWVGDLGDSEGIVLSIICHGRDEGELGGRGREHDRGCACCARCARGQAFHVQSEREHLHLQPVRRRIRSQACGASTRTGCSGSGVACAAGLARTIGVRHGANPQALRNCITLAFALRACLLMQSRDVLVPLVSGESH